MWRKIRRWFKRIWKRCQYRRGWRICLACRSWQKIECKPVYLLFEDEPPMFVEWKCTGCGKRTGLMPTMLTTDAVKSLGYKDFNDYAEKNGLTKKAIVNKRKTEEGKTDG